MKRATALIASIAAGLAPKVVFAQLPKDSGLQKGLDAAAATNYGPAASGTDLPRIIGNLINTAFGIFGTLLLIYILYGGYLWMTAAGDHKKVETAQAVIKNAIIGVTILVFANFIAAYVLGTLAAVV